MQKSPRPRTATSRKPSRPRDVDSSVALGRLFARLRAIETSLASRIKLVRQVAERIERHIEKTPRKDLAANSREDQGPPPDGDCPPRRTLSESEMLGRFSKLL